MKHILIILSVVLLTSFLISCKENIQGPFTLPDGLEYVEESKNIKKNGQGSWSYYDVSIFVVFCSFPSFPILEFPNILTSIRVSFCSLTIWIPILVFPNILFSIFQSHSSLTIEFTVLEFPFIRPSIIVRP